MPTILVRDIDTGKTIHSCWYERLADIWEPVSIRMAEHFGCTPDEVDCGESDQHGDVIEINGKIVATIEHVYRRVELRRPILQAAE